MSEKLANPAPLGLMGFGMTTILLNIHNAGFFPISAMILALGPIQMALVQWWRTHRRPDSFTQAMIVMALVGELLVVTFTRAAAAELKDRVRARLIEFAEALDTATKPDDALLALIWSEDRQVRLEHPLKEIGVFDVVVHLHADVEPTIKVWVVQQKPE